MHQRLFVTALLAGAVAAAQAAVVKVDAKEEPAGPYTRLTGKVHFASTQSLRPIGSLPTSIWARAMRKGW